MQSPSRTAHNNIQTRKLKPKLKPHFNRVERNHTGYQLGSRRRRPSPRPPSPDPDGGGSDRVGGRLRRRHVLRRLLHTFRVLHVPPERLQKSFQMRKS